MQELLHKLLIVTIFKGVQYGTTSLDLKLRWKVVKVWLATVGLLQSDVP